MKSPVFVDLSPKGQSTTPKLLVLFAFGTVIALFQIRNSGRPWRMCEVSEASFGSQPNPKPDSTETMCSYGVSQRSATAFQILVWRWR
jgi:hypothetical protein